MSTHTDTLEHAYRTAEAKAQKLMADKDEAIQKVKDRYAQKLQDANVEARDAQKAWADAVAADALLDRPDGQAVAASLGLTIPG
jgi:hypothetical protein